jgi:LacI family transcriptional regulator
MRRVGIMLELDWPYERHVGVFAGTQRYAQEAGWDCVVDEFAPETLAAARAYDGLIARAGTALASIAKRRRVPVVNTWFDSPARDLPLVCPDFAAVGRQAAEHLAGMGLRRFACLSIAGSRAQGMATTAFRDALGGLPCDVYEATGSYLTRKDRRQRFHRDLGRFIERWQPPVGVLVTFGDMTSRHLANEVRRRGLRIPDDVAIVAGMNEPMLCTHPAPSLTSIAVSYEDVGYRAARLLDQLMDGRSGKGVTTLLPPLGIVARQSTDFLAVDDEVVRAALRVIAAEGQRRLGVPAIAKSVHVTRRTLERRFRAALGRTVGQELRRLRLERAKRALLDTPLPVKAVARMTGFKSEQRLYEAFRRAEGLSPVAYRRARAAGK